MSLDDQKASVKSYFELHKTDALDLDTLYPISLAKAQSDPLLKRFFWLDEDGPFSEINKRGLQSLRKGFYKLVSKPYYKTTISPGTFAADVLYWSDENSQLIKYHANVGPLTNTSWKPFAVDYSTYNDITKVPILNKFVKDKANFGFERDYYIAKNNFFNSVFEEGRIILVADSNWDPAFPTINKRKQVTWCFIDF